MIVELSRADVDLVLQVARGRLENAARLGCRDRQGVTSYRSHALGAAGELVMHRVLEIPFDVQAAIDCFHKRPDVGGFEVRCTGRRDGALVVRKQAEEAPFDVPYVLVARESLRGFRVVGTISRRELERPEWWHVDRGWPFAWWVPQAALRPWPA